MPPKGMLSEERVEDSSADESSSPEPTQTLKERLNGIAKSASPAPVERISESDNDSSGSESDASSGSKSSKSSLSTQSKRKSHPVESSTAGSPSKRQKVDYNKIKRIEPTTYVPPQGYSTISMKASDMASLDMFDNLGGKQVWHISAPSTMPISKIESLNVASALKGTEVLKHKGVSYEMSRAGVEGANVLLPKGRNGEYASAAVPVTRAFRIQESSKPTSNGTASESANNHDAEADQPTNFFATQTGHKKAPRKQPENLKARYVPFGAAVKKHEDETGSSPVADEDVSMVDANSGTVDDETASQRTPKSSKKTKHKKQTADDMDSDSTPAKEKRGSQLSPSLDVAASQDGSQKRKKKKEKSKKDTV